MSDLQVCSPRPHGIYLGDDYSCPHLSRLPFPTSNSDPSLITSENWSRADDTAGDILCRIQPTLLAEQKRQEIIDYVQGLIRTRIGCEVFPYGSVPLKTYLPDGDIDLTAICCANIESAVVSDVHAVLKEQEINGASQFEVKEVHCIHAEVKLVKCIVQNIVVDISFNQLGGLCTLCFLEQVDRLAGKDHLFKQSIILIKAWCYYESRILGAHHGLISTYALETLVLYIFHLFHGSLHSPLAVLYRFLEYFSKFDWENYCISLHGPVSKSSLPDVVAKTPKAGGHELLLSDDFLRNCMEMFSISSGRSEPSSRVFTLKLLNIIDPLKENNNLGRSVSRGNFYRIRSAFKYGARKLGWILLLPEERTEAELNKFFANTLDRHCWTSTEFPTMDACFGVSVQSSAPLKTYFQDKACLERALGFRDEKPSGTEALPSSSSMSPHMQKSYPWQAIHQSQIRNHNVPSGIDHNGFAMGSQSNPVNHFAIVLEEKRRPQGIGTYLPRTNTCSYRGRQFQGKGKSQGQTTRSQLQGQDRSNQISATPQELSVYTAGGHEFSKAEFPVLGNGKTGSLVSPPSSYLSRWRTPQGKNDYWPHAELESWPIYHELWDATIPEASNPLGQDTLHLQDSSSGIRLSATEILKREVENNQERVAEQPFHLKNDEDFPPLSH